MNVFTFDLEATGLDVTTDRIVEFSIVRLSDGNGAPASVLSARVNPGIPITPAATAIHGIRDEDVSGAPPFSSFAGNIRSLFEGQIVAGYGINRFDLPLICEEMFRAGIDFDFPSVTWIDVGELYKQLAPRTLSAAVREFLDRDHAGAHGAEPDALATAEVFTMMRRRYPEKVGQATPAELALASRYGQPLADPAGKLTYIDGQLCFNFGKSKGVPVADDIGFARWMLARDFPEATKRVIEKEFGRLNNEANALPTSVVSGQAEIPY